jgi:hypothetical protein
MPSHFDQLSLSIRETAIAFLIGLNLSWVKSDWDKNKAAIIKCFLFGIMLPLLIIPVAAAVAVLTFYFAESVTVLKGWSSQPIYSRISSSFTSVQYTPATRPPCCFS